MSRPIDPQAPDTPSAAGPAEPAGKLETEIEVRYAETDQMGVVHHANYVIWFELARTRLCARSGFHYAEVEKMGYLLMVTGVEVKYRRPARYGDHVRVACWAERLASRGVRFAYEVRRHGDLLAAGATDHVWVEAATGRPCRLPAALREPFERLARTTAEDPGAAPAPSGPLAAPE